MDNNTKIEFFDGVDYLTIEENNLLPSIGLTHEQFLANVRSERNLKLIATDWTVLPDSPLSEELQQQYKNYRQALRDITEGLNSYQDLVWPVQPE